MLKKILVAGLVLTMSNFAVFASDVQKIKGGMCALTRTLSINELTQSAGIIFKGSLLSIEDTKVPVKGQDHDLNARKITLKVDDAIKGVSGSTYTTYEWMSLSSPFTDGEIKKGESYVFFFNLPSEVTGLSSLVGFEQGLMSFDESGVPQISARVLSKSAQTLGQMDSNIKSLSLGRASTSKSPKNYQELKSLIQQLQ